MAKLKWGEKPPEPPKPIPMNERPGRCRICAGCSFRLRYELHKLMRLCLDCGDDKEM